MKNFKIQVSQCGDGFDVYIREGKKQKIVKSFNYNQEDTAEVIAELLKYLGHDAFYDCEP